jgi:translation initiation factor IF-3
LSNHTRINNQIFAKELRIIGDEGENLGVMSKEDALKLAEEREVDLIEISPTAVPPVGKLMDFGKWQYLENRKTKLAKANSHITETKSLQIKIGTGEHDLGLKAKKIGEFLEEGHRVKIELFLPGRSKYLEKTFLDDRLARILKLIPVNYKVAEEPKKGPKGLYMVVEKSLNKPKEESPETPNV